MNNRRNKKLVRSLKDYMAPIIGGLLLIFIVYSLISGDETVEVPQDSGQQGMVIDLNPPDTEAYVEYTGGKKSKIESSWVQIFPWDKLSLSTVGSAKLSLGTDTLHLNKLGNIAYNAGKTFTLYSSDLFVNTSSSMVFDLKYMKVSSSGENQAFNLTQNEVSSTIYVVSGNVEVQNSAGVSVMVGKWEKLSVMKNDANSKEVDLNGMKEMIDEYIKSDDWYIANNADSFLNQSTQTLSGSTTSSGETLSWVTVGGSSGFGVVSFDILDESDSDKEMIDVSGTLLDNLAYKIEINGIAADINPADRTFVAKWVKLTSRVNDIVYRVFDEGNKQIDKWVFTIYYSKATSTTSSDSQTNDPIASVENYSLAKSPLYTIVAPKSNPYITSENNIRIEGTVPARTIEKIVINDFQLQKFPKNGTYWYYFANAEFGNLKEWLNIYKIQYYGEWNKLVYENTFTIVKEAPKKVEAPAVVAPTVVEETSSTEVTETASGTQQ